VTHPPVCLIIPPSPFLLDDRVFPSLGVLRVASSLIKQGVQVDVLDLSGIRNFEETVRAYCAESPTLYFGITSTTPQFPSVCRILEVLREERPACRVTVGGPHPTLVHAAARSESKRGLDGRGHRALRDIRQRFDTVVAGDGDMIPATAMFRPGTLVDADDPKGPFFMRDSDYDAAPGPARHLIDLASYRYSIEGRPATSLIGQLGCLAAGTKIAYPDGSEKNIEDVRDGDVVLSFDEKTGKIIDGPVVQTYSREADDLFELTFDDGSTVYVTGEHPIWTTDGWKETRACEVGTLCGAVHRLSENIHCEMEERKVLQQQLLQERKKLLNVRQDRAEAGSSVSAEFFLQQGLSERSREIIWNQGRSDYGCAVEEHFETAEDPDTRFQRPSGKISKPDERVSKLSEWSNASGEKSDETTRGVREGLKQGSAAQQDQIIWRRVTAKRFIGRSTVYNLTVCPGHSYLVAGTKSLMIFHNCPFSCGFCGGRLSPMLRRIRTRSTQSVVEEVRALHLEHGYTGFMFYDDELNVSKDMVRLMDSLSDLQSELGVDFRLRGFVKAELFTAEQAAAMHRAGFRWLLTGFESGSPRILDNMNKRATREENTRAIELARAAGLKVKALMSLGHPGESEETAAETRDWLLRVAPDDFDLTIITTYPGSPYYDDAEWSGIDYIDGDEFRVYQYRAPRTGDVLYSYEVDYSTTADYYKGVPGGGYRAYVSTEALWPEDLVAIRDEIESGVRSNLGIPFNPSAVAVDYEHSMGQGLPSRILRGTGPVACPKSVVRLPVVK
jgi:radical SAM superfamily enzyme YgiQ (UPF0313 family)